MSLSSVALGVLLVPVLLLSCTASNADLIFSPESVILYPSQIGLEPVSTADKTVDISDDGTGTRWWLAIRTAPWLSARPFLGSASGSITVTADATGLSAGKHDASVVFLDLSTFRVVGILSVSARVCAGICVTADAADSRHTVDPTLFGSMIEWLDAGGGVWESLTTPSCDDPALTAGAPRAELMDKYAQLGLRLLRYPGGIPGDFFNWYEAVGPVADRVPQVNPWVSTSTELVRQCPVFGPDEFAEVAATLQTPMLINANAGNGTAREAADFLTYYRSRGTPAPIWEIGNENYIPGIPVGDPDGVPYYFAGAYLSPSDYAAKFDEFARELRAVDPDIKVGMVAAKDFIQWDASMFAQVTEPAEFIAMHLLEPSACVNPPAEIAYKVILAAPEKIGNDIEIVRAVARAYAIEANRNLDIAVTEHGTLFFDCFGRFGLEIYERNRTLAAGLFSALSYNLYISDPKVTIANHVRLSHPLFNAPFTTGADGFSNPIETPLFYVMQLYSASAGGTVLGSVTQNSPTYSAPALGRSPRFDNLPVLHTLAVRPKDQTGLWLYVVNRSLTDDVSATVSLVGLADPVQAINVITLTSESYEDLNPPEAPSTVVPVTTPLPPAEEFEFTFPAHSLVLISAQ